MKTGTHPFVSKLKLFFKWGIDFDTEKYTVEDKGTRKVHYTNKEMIEGSIFEAFPHVYDESIVRQMIECIKVFKDGKLLVIFGGGYEVEVLLQDTE